MTKFQKFYIFIILVVGYWLLNVAPAGAATLSLSPTTGSFTVGSTFEVSVLLNTQEDSVNTVVAGIKFPADRLQLVSPTTGMSIIEIWLTPPRFNNQTGEIEFRGGIPNGINVDNGLITKLTFRVKGPGQAVLRFLDNSAVLLNDGHGTEALRHTQSAIYDLVLPPPAGPIVVSPTHPDQARWYANPNAVLEWAHGESVQAYSHVLNEDIIDIPDDISEGMKELMLFKNLSDGRHYFHIKALRENVWGGVTHFVLNVDTSPPSDFPIKILPDEKTAKRQVVVQFDTTDKWSGMDHYDLKLVPLSSNGDQQMSIEVSSPFVTSELELGAYDIIVRAYDVAGNYREVTKRIEIVNPIFKFVADEGIEVGGWFLIPWLWLWIVLGLIILFLALLIWYLNKRHKDIEKLRQGKQVPQSVKEKLEELQKYKEKYGKMAAMLLLGLCLMSIFSGTAIADSVELGPPIMTTISRNITNEEIFYVGGKTEAPLAEVIIYLQNVQTGETKSEKVSSDKRGDWFYRHDGFLVSGNYLLWAQTKIGEESSPPSPQIAMSVRSTALQFGASRISYEVLYVFIIVLLTLLITGLTIYTIYRAKHLSKKHKLFTKEISEAEEAVRTGFAILRRDIEAELAVVKKVKAKKELTDELKEKELQLLADLKEVERYIGKEVFDIEKAEYTD